MQLCHLTGLDALSRGESIEGLQTASTIAADAIHRVRERLIMRCTAVVKQIRGLLHHCPDGKVPPGCSLAQHPRSFRLRLLQTRYPISHTKGFQNFWTDFFDCDRLVT